MKLDYYEKYISEFTKNPKRICTSIPTANSYHAKLIHDHCDKMNLEHKSVIKGTRKRLTCPTCACHGENISLSQCRDDHLECEFKCYSCNYTHTTDIDSIGKLSKLYSQETNFYYIEIRKSIIL